MTAPTLDHAEHLDVISTSGGVAIGTLSCIVLSIWNPTSMVPATEPLARAMRQVVSAHGKIAMLTVLRGSIRVSGQQLYGISTRFHDEFGDATLCSARVLQTEGFAGAALMAAFAATSMIRRPYPVRSFSEVSVAAQWMAETVTGLGVSAPTPQALLTALSTLAPAQR